MKGLVELCARQGEAASAALGLAHEPLDLVAHKPLDERRQIARRASVLSIGRISSRTMSSSVRLISPSGSSAAACRADGLTSCDSAATEAAALAAEISRSRSLAAARHGHATARARASKIGLGAVRRRRLGRHSPPLAPPPPLPSIRERRRSPLPATRAPQRPPPGAAAAVASAPASGRLVFGNDAADGGENLLHRRLVLTLLVGHGVNALSGAKRLGDSAAKTPA